MAEIVIVEDDVIWLKPYISHLKIRGHVVRHYIDADSYYRRVSDDFGAALVVDVMLPSKNRYSEADTFGHRYTGLLLGRDVRRFRPRLPILFLSSLHQESEITTIRSALRSMGNCAFASKKSFDTYLDFAKLLETISTDGVAKIPRMGFFRRLRRGLIVQPNAWGIGFDLKEFIDEG